MSKIGQAALVSHFIFCLPKKSQTTSESNAANWRFNSSTAMVAYVRPLINRAMWKHSFSVNSCPFLAFDSVNSSWALQLSCCRSALLRSLNKQWREYGVPFGLRKSRFLLVTLLVENGRETKTHRTKDQQSNIIGSHTVSDKKYLFSHVRKDDSHLLDPLRQRTNLNFRDKESVPKISYYLTYMLLHGGIHTKRTQRPFFQK